MSNEITDEEVERDLRFAIEAARNAGRILMGLRKAERWEDEMLGDVGDQAADGYLQGLLLGRYPYDGVLSEETADSPHRLVKNRAWIIDPLDGTKEYRALRHDWAVHVALTIAGKCALAAVAIPAEDRVLYGTCLPDRHSGGIEGDGELLRADESEGNSPPRVMVSRSHTPPWVQSFCETIGAEMVPNGSVGFKVSRLLLGEADIYVHKRGLKEWDTCAPEVIARSLGWHVCKLRGDEHRYNLPDPHNHELVVCRPEWRERVLEAVAKSGALAAN